MHPEKSVQETTKEADRDDIARRQETVRRWSSAFVVALTTFVVAYAVVASNFDHWGAAYGWLPSSAIAAAFGWIGHCFPWIGDVIALLWDLLNLLAMFT